MTVISEHDCPACGAPVIVTRRNPNRRFCSARCRTAHHRNAVTNDVPTTNAVPNAVPNDVANAVWPAVSDTNGVSAANGVQRCPHCQTELAVIAVVVPATAAHIHPPEVTPMTPT
jgi:endogenous inhibitor of DNA gyrase (YacG/DUF329 family)